MPGQAMSWGAENAMLDKLFADVRVGMALTDSNMRWVKVNPALCRLLGYREDELVGHDPREFTHPDDISLTAKAFRGETPSTGLDVEKRYMAKDGSVIWTLLTISVTADPTSGEQYHIAQMQDITLRKRAEVAVSVSEARWRMLLAHIQEIVLLADLEGRLTYAAPSMERWLGYAPEELIGMPLAETTHPDDREAVMHAFAQAQSAGPQVVTHRVSHVGGTWNTVRSTLISLRDDPTVEAVLIASIDVSDQLAIEEERERIELERRVSHRLEAVGQLAAGIAHEINTPLQFVGDSVSFLRGAVDDLVALNGRYRELMWAETPMDLEQRQATMRAAEDEADLEYLIERIPAAFERTADGVDRVRSIVQAMKRFSHTATTEFAPADLNEGIATTLEVSRNEYKYHAEIQLDLQADLPLVTCNLGEINQVLLNLIMNAAQAIAEQRSDGGGLGQVAISTHADGDHAVIRVADNGPGIPEELQDRIYEPFFTTKPVGQGTGQGLALARTTVARHRGTLECLSTAGLGTTFTIRLPFEQPSTAAISGDEHAESESSR